MRRKENAVMISNLAVLLVVSRVTVRQARSLIFNVLGCRMTYQGQATSTAVKGLIYTLLKDPSHLHADTLKYIYI